MIERTPAHDIPLPCYGIDYDKGTKLCQGCPHVDGCQTMMGNRLGHVSLSNVKFKPSSSLKLEGITDLDYENSKAEEVYLECFRAVFPDFRPDNPGSIPKFGQRMIEQCENAGTTLRMFLLTNMVGFKNVNPDRRFVAKLLLSEAAVKRVNTYRRAATSMFGTFDPQALDDLAENVSVPTVGNPMAESEELAARWISGFKARRPGNPYPRFFRLNEIKLHPCWLAIEPHYADYVQKYPPKTKAVEKVRSNVARVLKRMREHKGKAAYFSKCRAEAAQDILESVLSQHGLRYDCVQSLSPVTDLLKFWADVGIVAQHVACLRYLRGDTTALRKFMVTGSQVDVR